MTKFSNTLLKKNNIIDFARLNFIKKLPITDVSSEHLNYVKDHEFKYFLSDTNWDLLYKNLLHKHLFEKGQTFSLLNNQESVQLNTLKNVILLNLKELIFEDDLEVTKGRPVKVQQLNEVLKEIITANNVEEFAAVIFHKLEDLITNSLLKNDLSSDFSLELPETSLNNSLGMSFFNAYFFSFKDYMSFLNTTDSNKQELFEDFFMFIFDIYNTNVENLTSAQYKIIISELKTKFDLNLSNPILIDLICKKTIIYVIKKLQKDPYTIKYMGIANYFTQQQITSDQMDIIESVLNSSLTVTNVLLGSIFVNKLIDNDIFEVFYKPKYKQKDTEQIGNSLGETTLTIRIKQSLIYDFTLNSSNFKPLLIESNRKNMENDFKFYKDDIILNFKLSSINESIHINKTGKGSFNPESLFSKDHNLSNIRLSIDNHFLENYLQLTEQLSGKKWNNLSINQKEDALAFLSIYGINFTLILANISPEYFPIICSLIDYCLDLHEYADTKDIVHLKNIIDNIHRNNIKNQLMDILRKIRAYKLVLILALQEYIIYSIFNFSIMPSYFDFRGRRYFIGVAFNIQSYPFLKAFVKIHELDIKLLTEDLFMVLRENILNIINDDTLKKRVNEKMSSLSLYTRNLIKEKLNFLYSHIDETKMNYDSFKSLVEETDYDFITLYKKIISIIKKSSKALMITSYILLEKRKGHTIINYSNNYSYDMVTSGYQQSALIFPTHEMGKITNLIGNTFFDLYADLGNDSNTWFFNGIALLNKYLATVALSDIQNTLALMHYHNLNYDNIFKILLNNNMLTDFIIKNRINIFQFKWILFPADIGYLEKYCLFETKDKFELKTGILILGRISCLQNILNNNKWLLDKKILGSRGIMKHIIMIELYGGSRRGREAAYKNFISETCLEHGVMFHSNTDKHLLFYFIESHYQLYKENKLYGAQRIKKLAKVLADFEKVIVIKNPNFICKLGPTKFHKDKRIQINTMRIKTARRPYQLTINRPSFTNLEKLTKTSIIINKKKLMTLFPPDFIHSMDAMVPHIILLKFYKLNNCLEDKKLKFNVISIHDNLASGATLFNIIPEILFDTYKEIFTYNYLNSLKENFTEKEFNIFLDVLKVQTPFTKDDINNPHMMKYG